MRVVLKIEGMSCSACSNKLEKYLNNQQGIINASVNLVMREALIEYDETLTINDLNRFVKEAGFTSLGEFNNKEEKKTINKKVLIFFTILMFLLMYISLSQMLKLPSLSIISKKTNPINYGLVLLVFSLIFIIYGFNIIKRGIKNLINKSSNMDTLVTLGVIASFIYSSINLILVICGRTKYVNYLYFESIAMVIYFVKLGRILEERAKDKTKETIKELVQITPEKALIQIDDNVKEITIDEIKKGDYLIAKPGMKIAVDGIVVDGEAHIDESFLTGESVPLKKSKSDKVMAGTINLDGIILYRAERIGKDSTISEIVRLVVEATNTKTKVGRIVDKVCSYFVPVVFVISILSFIINLILGHGFNTSIISFVTVLTVACPCALGIATPLAIIVSVGAATKNKILIKSSEKLEEINKIDTVVFDKTGTLTYGRLRVSEIFNYSTYSKQEILDIVGSLENNSLHPIATAFKVQKLRPVEKFSSIAGIGISGIIENNKYYIGNNKLLTKLNIEAKYKYSCKEQEEQLMKNGNSVLYVLENKKVIALIGVKDIIRDNSKELIENLKSMNKNIIMLTGDNEETATIISKTIGIDNVVSNLLPQDKAKYIKELRKNNHKIMMVGDGINDAIALITADIGVSIKSGTNIANEEADIILMNDDLSKVLNIFTISTKTKKIIKQNLFWALIYNIFTILLATTLIKPFGLKLTPPVASIAMTISSLTVILNSLRLRK